MQDNTDDHRLRRGAMRLALAASLLFGSTLPILASTDGAMQADPQVTGPCPHGGPMQVSEMRLKALAKRVADRTIIKILAIGSSSTQGVGSTGPTSTYPARFEAGLKQQFGRDVSVTNAGVGGETAETTLARLEERVTAEKFDLVIWQVGTNDAVRGADEEAFRAYLERGVNLVKAKQVELLLLDQQFFPSIKDPVRYERFVKTIEIVGTETGTPVLSRYKLMKTWGERAPQDLRTMLAGDGFHMSDRGYFCLAHAMVTAVSDLVNGKSLPDNIPPAVASVPRRMPAP